jgi:serine-type D-Ala-D-Ala carboxypeptidase/endopeptidase (penicillin-binding protein 4)
VFAIASDSVPVPKTLDARAALDRATAALANCGC